MTIMVILSGRLVAWLGTKSVVIGGLLITSLASVLAFIAPNLTVLLGARLLLGVGLGCYNSLAVSLISIQYYGEQRRRLMGFQNATQGLGAMLASLAVSGLLLLGSRYAFLIYLISLPIAWSYFNNVPNVQFPKMLRTTQLERTSSRPALWYYVITLFLLMTLYMVANLTIPSLILTRHIGTASTGAVALSLFSLGTILAGVSFGRLKVRLPRFILVLSMLTMLMGFLGLLWGQTKLMIMLASFLIGGSFGLYVPEIFNTATTLVTKDKANTITMVLMTSSNLASFGASFFCVLLKTNGTNASLLINAILILFVLIVINLSQNKRLDQAIE